MCNYWVFLGPIVLSWTKIKMATTMIVKMEVWVVKLQLRDLWQIFFAKKPLLITISGEIFDSLLFSWIFVTSPNFWSIPISLCNLASSADFNLFEKTWIFFLRQSFPTMFIPLIHPYHFIGTGTSLHMIMRLQKPGESFYMQIFFNTYMEYDLLTHILKWGQWSCLLVNAP